MTRCILRNLAPKEAQPGECGSADAKARLARATRAEFQALEKKKNPFPQPKLKHQVSIYNCNVLCESMQIAGLFAVARGGFCSAPRLEISVKLILTLETTRCCRRWKTQLVCKPRPRCRVHPLQLPRGSSGSPGSPGAACPVQRRRSRGQSCPVSQMVAVACHRITWAGAQGPTRALQG